jgi:hypothetical protein
MNPPNPTGIEREGGGERVKPVIFLDFDGVICSPRAFTAQAERWQRPQRELRWADPVACDMVRLLLTKHQASLVISSTWRASREQCDVILGRYEMLPFLHDDWRTGEDPQRFRGNEIAEWLAAHGHPPFVILDDDADMLPEQMPWLVHTCSINGMMLADYGKADCLLASMTGIPR